MKFTCQKCNQSFSLDATPKLCPFCGSDKVGSRGRFTVEQLITNYNIIQDKIMKLQKQLDNLAYEYIPLYVESTKIRSLLGVYKSRNVLTDDEMPKTEKQIIQCLVAKYPELVTKSKAEKKDSIKTED